MKNNPDIMTQFYEQLKVWSTFIAYNMIGIAANYADHYRKGTLTKKQAIVSGVMGIVSGYMAYQICIHYGFYKQMGLVIPAATMLGERLIPYIIDNGLGWVVKWANKKKDGTAE